MAVIETDDTRAVHLCTRAEAFKLLAASTGRQWFVRVGTFLVTEKEGDTMRGFENSASVAVSRKLARKAIDDLLSEGFEKRGARLKITIMSNVAFVGM
jgi:hypothetical protein